jgi:hypothetical protein
MTQARTIKSLATLIALRENAIDRLRAEMAEKSRTRDRFHENLERLSSLCAGSGPHDAVSSALFINAAGYRQAVTQLADAHRVDLALHEADMARTQIALNAAAQKREVLGQVLLQRQRQMDDAERRVEQRGQDELATQLWFRGVAR